MYLNRQASTDCLVVGYLGLYAQHRPQARPITGPTRGFRSPPLQTQRLVVISDLIDRVFTGAFRGVHTSMVYLASLHAGREDANELLKVRRRPSPLREPHGYNVTNFLWVPLKFAEYRR